jgi:hypothetical protein
MTPSKPALDARPLSGAAQRTREGFGQGLMSYNVVFAHPRPEINRRRLRLYIAERRSQRMAEHAQTQDVQGVDFEAASPRFASDPADSR